MSFTSVLNSIDHTITWQVATTMVERYQSNESKILNGDFSTVPNTLLQYETFNLTAINNILEQADCQAFRVYMGMDADELIRCILVGVDGNGDDIIMKKGNSSLTVVEELGQRYP